MANRFDSFNRDELAILGLGVATASISLSEAGAANARTGADGEERRMIAAVAIDCSRLMNEIAGAELWGDSPPPSIADDVIAGLVEVRDHER